MHVCRTPPAATLGRLATLALALVAPAAAQAAPVTVVEFYNAALDHYFVSPLQPDIDALDSGRIPGWNRTGYNFVAYGSSGDAAGASAVCRFYIPPEHGDSHFFSASPDECATVLARIGTDPNYSGYVFETSAAFYAQLPDLATGACPAGTQPVFRLWNQRADSNHRYTADPAVRTQMIARGYLAEGYGPLGVAMCTPQPVLGDARVQVSGSAPYAPGCDAVAPSGLNYANAEVEPMVAVNPQDGRNLVGAWQQDRWSNGGARGLRTGFSLDGGRTWELSQAAFSRCSGGNAANGGDYARASDPWVSIGPTGIAHQIAIAFNGATFGPGSSNAVLASRSLDGGRTWSAPATLIRDGAAAFNDKETITADPGDGQLVYATWDRLLPGGGGPSWLARSTDAGATWEPARAIYTPLGNVQTINNQVVVLPDGSLRLFFTQLAVVNNQLIASLGIARSGDKGVTWAAPTLFASMQSVGTEDPDTHTPIRDAGNLASVAVGRNGVLALVWQDARFSGGAIDGVAFSRSLDGGQTWSAPVQVNRAPAAQALLPAVRIRDDGTYAVLYYDLRNNTPDPATLPTDVWLALSADGITWHETHVSGPFDLAAAPRAQDDEGPGLFVGDYQALADDGARLLPFFVQSKADAANRSDVFVSIVTPFAPSLAKLGAPGSYVARDAPFATRVAPDAVSRNVERLLARRRVGGAPAPVE